MVRGKCGGCGHALGDFAPQCGHCGAPNPCYSPANAWAAGLLGAALVGFAAWLAWQESFAIPARSGRTLVYQGWSLAGLVAQAASFGAAFLGLALCRDRFRGKATLLAALAVALMLADIAVRVAAD